MAILSFILGFVNLSTRFVFTFLGDFGFRLLGLQPGPANSPPPYTVPCTSQAAYIRKRRIHKRSRPQQRSLRYKIRRWYKRHLVPCITHMLTLLVISLISSTVNHATHLITTLWPFPHISPRSSPPPSSEQRLLPPPLPYVMKRVAPHRFHTDSLEWHNVSELSFHGKVIEALRVWTNSLCIPTERVLQWQHMILCTKPGGVRKKPDQICFNALLEAFACAGCLLESKASNWEHVQSLNSIAHAMSQWIFPPTYTTKRNTNITTDMLWLGVGQIKLALITDWQSRGGKRKSLRAVRRCLGLPTPVYNAFLDPKGWTPSYPMEVARFLSLQVFATLRELPGHAVLYQLSSVYLNYLGSTKYDVKLHQCQGASPTSRVYQHILEHKQSKSRGRQLVNRKNRCFQKVHFADHMFWILNTGPEGFIRSLEDAGIACWRHNCNSKGAGARKPYRSRHSKSSRSNRSRPRHRTKVSERLTAHADHFRQWHAAATKRHSLQRSHAHRCDLQLLLDGFSSVGYSTGYRDALRYMVLAGQGFGPVDILQPAFNTLLVRYVADARPVDWQSLHERLATRCNHDAASSAVVVATAIRHLPACSLRTRACQTMSRHLRFLGLAPLRGIIVPWPDCLPSQAFREIVQQMQRDTKKNGNVAGFWFCSLLKPIREKRTTFADSWRFIAVAKSFGNTYLATCPLSKLRPTSQNCAAMRRVKLHWRVPLLPHAAEIRKQTMRTLAWIARRAQCPTAFWAKPRLSSIIDAHCHATQYHLHLHDFYANTLGATSAAEVQVQEDKDKNACWIMPIHVYEKWCFWLFRQDVTHWSVAHHDLQSICTAYRDLHQQLLPPHLKHYASARKWRNFCLPYAYCTIKAKCFADDGQHICPKHLHSCFRRIISWRSHPAKHVYRNAGRAIMGIITALQVGFETANLFTAIPDFRSACSNLKSHSIGSMCAHCRNAMQGLSLCVCDAAQMYEELPPDKVRTAVAFLIERIKALHPGSSGIAVAKQKKLRTWVAKGEFRNRGRCTVWTWDDIQCVLDLALRQPIVRLGEVLFKQLIGAPIGGHLSKAIASAVLAYDEMLFSIDAETKMADYVPGMHLCFKEAVACTRYVDDLAMASHVLCPQCLQQLTTFIYSPPVSFDPAKPDTFGHPWLDVWLYSSNGELGVRADGAEAAWKQAGGAGMPQKFRIKPWLGDSAANDAELRALAAGKLSRLKAMRLEPAQLHAAVGSELCLWALSGYPLATIRKAWTSTPHYPEASQCAHHHLNTWHKDVSLPSRVRASWESL